MLRAKLTQAALSLSIKSLLASSILVISTCSLRPTYNMKMDIE